MKISVILAAAILIGCAGIQPHVHAQTAAGLLPPPKYQPLDLNGATLPGGKVFTYAAGTTTPLASYTDSTGGTPNANPVILDSAGRASIWLGAAAYKIVLQTSTGASVYTVDNVTSPTLSTASVTIPSGQTLTLQSGASTSFSADLLSGASNTRNIGSSSNYWNAAWISSITVGGNILPNANNSFDVGSQSSAFANMFGFNVFSQNLYSCGISGGGTMTNRCWNFNVIADGSANDYMTLEDNTTGTILWKWQVQQSGVTTNTAYPGMNLVPNLDNTFDMVGLDGSGNPLRWRNLAVSGQLTAGGSFSASSTSSFVGAAGFSANALFNAGAIANGSGSFFKLQGGADLRYSPLSFATLSGMAVPAAGFGAYFCTDCTAGSSPCAGGGTGHVTVSNGTNFICN